MNRRKGNGTSTKKNDLRPPQQTALEQIEDKTRGLHVQWVDVSHIDPRPLRALHDAGLIELYTISSKKRSACLTPAGWTRLGKEMPADLPEHIPSTPTPEPEQPARPQDEPTPRTPSGGDPKPPLAPMPPPPESWATIAARVNREVDEELARANGHAAPAAPAAPQAADCGDNCRHRQVLRLLMDVLGDKQPQLIELIDALETVQRIAEEL